MQFSRTQTSLCPSIELNHVLIILRPSDKERNNSREEIIEVGDVKFSLYINDNTTIDSLLHTLGETKYEKIYC